MPDTMLLPLRAAAPDEALARRLHLAARYYAARIERRGFCYCGDLIEDGFEPSFLLDNWNTIRERGEDLAAARRRAASGERA